MTTVAILLLLLWLLDGLRLQGRLRSIPVLGDGAGDDSRFVVLAAPGVEVSDAVTSAAAEHARRESLGVVDLIPPNLPSERLLGLLALVDPAGDRARPLAQGRTAGCALLVDRELLEQSEIDPGATRGPEEFTALAARLKSFAPRSMGLAFAPGLSAGPDDLDARARSTMAALGSPSALLYGVQVTFLVLPVLALLFSPFWGALAVLAFHLQPRLVTGGSVARPRDLGRSDLLRFWDTARWTAALGRQLGHGFEPDAVEDARPIYRELLADGTAPFFQSPHASCPLCDSRALSVKLETWDLIQQKPGTFRVDRCGDCGHLFQNPPLSVRGLEYYYRDFYDGLGERDLALAFGAAGESYSDRALLPGPADGQEQWLDVGGGHGHLALIGKELRAGTAFHGLDLSDAIEEASRRGWVDRAIRGLFPELADGLADQYDVVSMSHYLEHTMDPRPELAAAATVLRGGGRLLIELPDPECRMQAVLGRWWLPFFQPQHQHFLSVANLRRLLDEAGFDTVTVERGVPHQPVDFLFAAWLLLDAIGPDPHRPWLPPAGPAAIRRWLGVRALLWWLLPIAFGLDRLLAAVWTRRPGWSNTYRLLARKREESVESVAPPALPAPIPADPSP